MVPAALINRANVSIIARASATDRLVTGGLLRAACRCPGLVKHARIMHFLESTLGTRTYLFLHCVGDGDSRLPPRSATREEIERCWALSRLDPSLVPVLDPRPSRPACVGAGQLGDTKLSTKLRSYLTCKMLAACRQASCNCPASAGMGRRVRGEKPRDGWASHLIRAVCGVVVALTPSLPSK